MGKGLEIFNVREIMEILKKREAFRILGLVKRMALEAFFVISCE